MSVRQEKFSGLIQEHLAEIFLRHTDWFKKAFITISKVEMSPDLSYAKVFLSFFKVQDKDELLKLVNFHNRDIRKQLAVRVRNQARVVPELNFIIDDSLDYVFHMDEVMKKVQAEDERKKQDH